MRVVVVGAGVAGLSAALEVRSLRPDAEVVLLETSGRVGGKVTRSEVGGVVVDEGADAMLTRVPDGVALARAAGLETELVAPAAGQAAIWSRGRLVDLPTGTLLGVPTDLDALARSGLLSNRGLLRVPLDLVQPGGPVVDDISVGDLVARRFGREVVDRLVDPLLGGVYAGRAEVLSLRATLPQLVAPAARHRSLLLAAREARAAGAAAAGPGPAGPIFAGLPGGMGRLPEQALVAGGAELRLRTTARALTRTPTGWRLTTGSAAEPAAIDADAVVLAVPAAAAVRLLGDLAPPFELDYASVAIITLVLDGPTPGRGSGFLVPAVEGRTTKAVTFSSRKWAHLSRGPAVVRASVGRYGETADLQREDAELVAVVASELVDAVGPLPALLGSRVTRWGGGLPQYAVGHLDRVAALRAALARHPGLAVAGAAYDGVGVPACARSGRDAARAALAGTTRNGAVAQNGGHDPDQT